MAKRYLGRSDNAANADLDAIFTVARGGTGISSVSSGNLLLGAGTGVMTELAPGASGGYVRSNGTTWARASGVAAADVVAGTLAGTFTFALGFSVTSGTTALQALTATTGVFSGSLTATTGTFSGTLELGISSTLRFGSRSRIQSSADSLLCLTNAAETDFARLQFGGTTNNFPSLKRNGTNLVVRLADDSADSGLFAGVFIATVAAVSGGAGTVTYGGTTQTTVGGAGGASALPATPRGYVIINVAGTDRVMPFYDKV